MLVILIATAPWHSPLADDACGPATLCRQVQVPNEYIVRFDPAFGLGAKGVSRVAEDLERQGISVIAIDDPNDAALIRLDDRSNLFYKEVIPSVLIKVLNDFLGAAAKVDRLTANHFVYGMYEGYCSAAPKRDWARQSLDIKSAHARITTPLSVIVAVLDSGTEIEHPLLERRVWQNLAEHVGNDDDENTITSDLYGASFLDGKASGTIAPLSDHGTQVSGIIAADASRPGPLGIAQNAKILTVRILGKNNRGTSWGAASGINYAVHKHTDIINMSWATPCADKYVEEALVRADAKGTLLVASAGNANAFHIPSNNDQCPLYPGSYQLAHMIAVGATGIGNMASTQTRFGASTIDIGAPGDNVATTDRSGLCGVLSGTSASAPVVTGVAALMASFTPGWSWLQRRKYLLDSVELPTDLSQKLPFKTGGWVNAGRATAPPLETLRVNTVPPPAWGTSLRIDWTTLFTSSECPVMDILLSTDGGVTFSTNPQWKVNTSALTADLTLGTGKRSLSQLRFQCQGTSLSALSARFWIEN